MSSSLPRSRCNVNSDEFKGLGYGDSGAQKNIIYHQNQVENFPCTHIFPTRYRTSWKRSLSKEVSTAHQSNLAWGQHQRHSQVCHHAGCRLAQGQGGLWLVRLLAPHGAKPIKGHQHTLKLMKKGLWRCTQIMSYLQVSVASNMTSYCCSFSLLQDSTWPIPSLNQSPLLCYYLGIYCNFWFNTGNRPCEINVQSTGAIFLLKPHTQTAC